MKLIDFEDKIFTSPGRADAYTVIVVEDEDSADSWIEDHFDDGDNRDSCVLCVLHGESRWSKYLKEEILNREVSMIYAAKRDLFVIVLGE